MTFPANFYVDTVSVETLTGSGAYGDVWADGTDLACYVADVVKMVRNSQGDEVVSSATLYADPAAYPDATPTAGQCAPGSKVTVNGREALVLTVAKQTNPLAPSLNHTVVTLT